MASFPLKVYDPRTIFDVEMKEGKGLASGMRRTTVVKERREEKADRKKQPGARKGGQEESLKEVELVNELRPRGKGTGPKNKVQEKNRRLYSS